MVDCEYQIRITEYDYDDNSKEYDYFTNPLDETVEFKRTSWLDDYGWI